MTEPNEQYAYFTISGDFDPAEISKRVDVTPTEAWVKGDINPRTRYERKCSRWLLYSRLEKSCELEAHISDVIEQLGAKKNDFVALSFQHGGQMQLVAYFKTAYPGLIWNGDWWNRSRSMGSVSILTFITFTPTAVRIRSVRND
jgi:hypothetical protein